MDCPECGALAQSLGQGERCGQCGYRFMRRVSAALRKDSLHAFLLANRNRTFPGKADWISEPPLRAYVRIGEWFYGGERAVGFTIASVAVQPTAQRRGHFKAFLKKALDLMPYQVKFIRVESVSNMAFAAFFRRNNWIEEGAEPFPSFYLPIQSAKERHS